MTIKRKITRRRVNNPNIDTALNDIYNKLERLLPATMQELIATTHEPDEGTVIVIDDNEAPESSGGGSSIAFYKGGQWNIDINSKYVPANKNGFKALSGSKGASGRIIPGESVFYNKDGNLSVKSFNRDEVLLNVSTDKLSIRKSDNSADADIAGANATFSGNNLKLGTDDVAGLLLKNDGGILIIDYGYLNSKMHETLQAIKNHKYSKVLEDIGESDITYNINFNLFEKFISQFSNLKSIITNQKKLPIAVLTADCVPLLIYENNSVLGRANKFLLPLAKKILLSNVIKKNFPQK